MRERQGWDATGDMVMGSCGRNQGPNGNECGGLGRMVRGMGVGVGATFVWALAAPILF
jgi:hypothetical protein